jgi:tetratricopeptide (TPR) repeat protein
MALSVFLEQYDSTWQELMQEQHKFPLREYSDRTVLTTWKMSYEQVRVQNEGAAYLLKLWALLDCGDMWYELIAPARSLRLERDIEVPDWLLLMTENQLKFSSALRLLSRYSLVDAREETSSHSMHAVLHKWCYQLCADRERQALSVVAVGIVASMVASESDFEYWRLQRRLLLHGIQIYPWAVDDVWTQAYPNSSSSQQAWMFFQLGALFASQDKLGKAEEMYERALKGCEKALGPEQTSTLSTVHNLGILYADQGELDKAEEMYERALKGYKKALGHEHTSTLSTVNNLGLLYADQGELDKAEEMYERALKGYEKALGHDHLKCKAIRHALQTLDTLESNTNMHTRL